jgi:uncharacterized membrane protein
LETRRRSLVKSLTWRVGGVVITTLVALVMTGKAEMAMKIGLADMAFKFFIYYGHERLWTMIPYGRVKPASDYEI